MKFLGKLKDFLKKNLMLAVSLIAAIISLFITPPGPKTLAGVDWKTLATLFMLLSILDGFKSENLFLPVLRLSGKIKTHTGLSLFLIFGVFFSSMFVTNDVSLIIFVPLTIILFRAAETEELILPVICMENIAAVRGSLLTPFGSPQNLFLFAQSGISAGDFLLMMLPLWLMSMVLLVLFVLFLHRKNLGGKLELKEGITEEWKPERKGKRILYLALFALVIVTIVTRTTLWPYVTGVVVILLLIFDRAVFKRVDYALLLTFFCFFLFSSSIAENETVAGFLNRIVPGNEYLLSIGISQVISNVPASIVLWNFTDSLRPLIYGLDTAGLVTVIGSLASVINMRIYTREYPGKGGRFMLTFEIVSLAFFVIVAPIQWLMLTL